MQDVISIPKVLKDGVYYYDSDWLNVDLLEDYKDEVKKCIEFCKPDMFFSHLYVIILKYGFEKLSLPVPSIEEGRKIYLAIAQKILEEKCFIQLSDDQTDYSVSWNIAYGNYGNEIEKYKLTILNYINYQPHIYPIIGLKETDNPYLSDRSAIFFQHVMFGSFLIAYNRIRTSVVHNGFLDAEIIPFLDNMVLNVYLTPLGISELPLIESWGKGDLLNYFNSFTHSIGFNRIYDKDQLSKFNTTVLLEKDGNLYCHFIPPFYSHANDFIMHKLRRPYLTSLRIETQVSFRQIV